MIKKNEIHITTKLQISAISRLWFNGNKMQEGFVGRMEIFHNGALLMW